MTGVRAGRGRVSGMCPYRSPMSTGLFVRTQQHTGRVGSVTPSAVRVDAMLVLFRRLCQRPLRLDHVNPDEDDLRSATVLRPMVDVARLRDEATRSERLGVAALPELGEMATQNIGERRTLLMAMKPRHPPGLEGDRPQAKLVAGEIRAEIDRALDPGVESLVLGGRSLLSKDRTQPNARSERARADEDDDSPRSPHDRFSFHGPPEGMNPRPPKGPLTQLPIRH